MFGDLLKKVGGYFSKPPVAPVVPMCWIYPENNSFVVDPTGSSGKLLETKENIPVGIVVHHTVSYDLDKTIEQLKKDVVSVHFIIGKNGEIVQMVPCNEIAYHAGVSKWGKLDSLNKYFIGIEVINLGPLTRKDNQFSDAYGREYKGTVRERDGQGYKYWAAFTDAQEASLLKLCKWLVSTYKIKPENITGHFEVSPGRKNDPFGGMKLLMSDFRKIFG